MDSVVMIQGFRCKRCGHEWVARKKDGTPIQCPKCRTPYWNKDRIKR